jgi:hypothetical protein
MKAIAVLIGCVLVSGCGVGVHEGEAVRAVEALGFEDVAVLDKSVVFHALDGCGDSDAASFAVRGKNPRGVVTTVTVCCGFPFKGCTVRH